MDLLSVGLRTIFYDINIAEVISDLWNGEHAYLDDHFSKLSILHENNFTLTELNSLRDYVKQKVGASDKYHWSAFFRLMPYFCKVISSKRTVLKAVVRAPMQPTLNRFIPFTTRQIAAKSRRFCANASDSGCTT